jgi:hypothetical protein
MKLPDVYLSAPVNLSMIANSCLDAITVLEARFALISPWQLEE